MGADIHMYFEERISYGPKAGKWERVEISPGNIIPDERWYNLWGFLFNVRDDSDEFSEHPFESRGIPEDSCFVNELQESSTDFWGFTYFTAKEIKSIKWPKRFEGCYFKIFCDHILPLISNRFYAEPENIRVVIAFDC